MKIGYIGGRPVRQRPYRLGSISPVALGFPPPRALIGKGMTDVFSVRRKSIVTFQTGQCCGRGLCRNGRNLIYQMPDEFSGVPRIGIAGPAVAWKRSLGKETARHPGQEFKLPERQSDR